MDARSARRTAEVCLFSFRRRIPSVYRRAFRLDGGRASAGDDRSEMEAAPRTRPSSGATTAHHPAHQVRYAYDGGIKIAAEAPRGLANRRRLRFATAGRPFHKDPAQLER